MSSVLLPFLLVGISWIKFENCVYNIILLHVDIKILKSIISTSLCYNKILIKSNSRKEEILRAISPTQWGKHS